MALGVEKSHYLAPAALQMKIPLLSTDQPCSDISLMKNERCIMHSMI